MAKTVLRDVLVDIDGVLLGNYAHDVSVEYETEEIDITALGEQYKCFMPGRSQATFQFGLYAGHTQAHDILNDAYRAGLTVQVNVRPTSASASSTNPAHTGDCYVTRYAPLKGSAGEAAQAEVELHSTGPAFVDTTGSGAPYPATSLYPSSTLYPSS